jgi:Mn-dependent DtxR family transcriptional regulator
VVTLRLGFFGKFGKFWKFGMKLTRRQEEFVTNLVDLNNEFNGPIHYSLLAERLGVSPFTAYDMLNVLEEKGAVISEYQLAAGKSGPGRAERLFYSAESVEEGQEDFERSTSVQSDEISYCVEVMDKVVSHLQQSPGRKKLLDYLPDLLPAGHTTHGNLTLLGGFAFGILAQENGGADDRIQRLMDHVQGYLSIVNKISPQQRDQLTRSLAEVFKRWTQETQ